MTRARMAVIGLLALAVGPPMPQALAAGHSHGSAHPGSHAPHGSFHRSPRFFPRRPTVVVLGTWPWLPFGYSDYGYNGSGYGYPPPVSYAALPPGYGAPAVYSPPPAYDPPPYYQLSRQLDLEPPGPRVVEYATGRYELRGDGIRMPYTWVWVPNPPSGPPEDSAPAPPEGAPARAAAPSHLAYRWTDESGVTTWTDRLDKVPARYRAQAQAQAQP